MAGAFGQGGGHRAERLESEILMAHQPLGQYELSCRVPPPGPGVQRYLARRPSLWRWRWRTKGGGEVEGRASDGTGGWARTPAKWWRCSPPPRRGPRAPLFIPRPSPGGHTCVRERSLLPPETSIELPPPVVVILLLQVAAEQQQPGRTGCRGRRTSTSTSCARSRATTSPPPPSSATTAPSGPRAPHSRR